MCRCEDVHRSRRERPLSLFAERPTLCEEQSRRGYETWDGQTTSLNSFVILIADTPSCNRFSPSNPCVPFTPPDMIPIGLRVIFLTLDRCSIWERIGKRSIGQTIGPRLQSTVDAAHNLKRPYCPWSSRYRFPGFPSNPFTIALPKPESRFSPPAKLERTWHRDW